MQPTQPKRKGIDRYGSRPIMQERAIVDQPLREEPPHGNS